MQQISFAIGHFLESSFQVLVALGWLPPVGIALLLAGGLVYWLRLQAKYNPKAEKDGTMA